MQAQKLRDQERGKLFFFSSVILVVLSIIIVYLEVYGPYEVPNFLRVVLAIYWLYLAVSIFVSKFASDKWVGKMCCNIFRK